MLTLVRIQPGPPSAFANVNCANFNRASFNRKSRELAQSCCPCGSVVEHTLGKGEVTSSILVMGFLKNLQLNLQPSNGLN